MNSLSLPVYGPPRALTETIYSTSGEGARLAAETRNKDPYVVGAQEYLEASLAAQIPAWPLSDPFLESQNYVDTVYLCIQRLMQSMYGIVPVLEKKVSGPKGKIASGGGQSTDQGYEPFEDHPLANILVNPNPMDTFADFVCQCVLNWNLHGRILIWARPNKVGAPIRYYCLPVPLCVPAFQVGDTNYPLGAWRLQQFYPTTGIVGIIPNGLMGNAGAIIDAREVYEMKNPHPVYRWAPYSHLTGGANAIDNIHNIDLSFWSVMSQGPKPAGFIDAPGADPNAIQAIQNKIDNAAGGARKHGRPIVLGGGDPDRPAIKWNNVGNLVPEALHEGGWEIYTSFVAALFGLDLSSIGLRRSGGHAERWAARKEERDMLTKFLSRLAAKLTSGGLVKNWGLMNQGVRITINLPEDVGYDPAEMSRDMSGDSSGSYNEVRRLRGFKAGDAVMNEDHNGKPIGDYPFAIAVELARKKLGIDDVSQQKQLGDMDAKRQEEAAKSSFQRDQQVRTEEQANNPENNRPETPKEAKGSLGGEGSGTPRTETKALIDFNKLYGDRDDEEELLPLQEALDGIIARILETPVLV